MAGEEALGCPGEPAPRRRWLGAAELVRLAAPGARGVAWRIPPGGEWLVAGAAVGAAVGLIGVDHPRQPLDRGPGGQEGAQLVE